MDERSQGTGKSGGLSHVRGAPDGSAEASMVDVGAKPVTERAALAAARLRFPEGVLGRIREGAGPKGSLQAIQEVARAAGTLAAKRTGELIPMCHPLGLDHLDLRFQVLGPDVLEVRCRAVCRGRTGVEMEALLGATMAALTLYDMTKALDPGIRIEEARLLEKTGGKRGHWQAPPAR